MPRPASPRLLQPLRWLGLALAVAATGVAGVSIAEACGGFFRPSGLSPEQQPSLSREKVLLIHDRDEGRQHFVREVAFARATEPFGFVVPTPTRPEVAAVELTPFTKLRNLFSFTPLVIGRGAGGGGAKGYGGDGGGSGVTVLEQKQVGSFTAFVLAATDAKALASWLDDNELVSTPEADAWLAHYVTLGFYYVAMRYDPETAEGAGSLGAVTAETMRISFDTPLPYYPYLEPTKPEAAKAGLDPRLMELWVVGQREVIPVALQRDEDGGSWVQPLAAGEVYRDSRELLSTLLEPELRELLPAGKLVVQTFQDQKNERAGFEDIVFANAEFVELTADEAEALTPMLALLDPALAPTREEAKP